MYVLTSYVFTHALTAFLLFGLLMPLIGRRNVIPAKSVLLIILSVMFWNVICSIEAAAVDPDTKQMWTVIQYIFAVLPPVFFFNASLQFTDTNFLTSKRLHWIVYIPAFSLVVIAFTNHIHHLLWNGWQYGPTGTNTIILTNGPLFALVIIYIGLYALATIWVLIRHSIRHKMFLTQELLILFAATFPWIATLLYAFHLSPWPGLRLVPISFAATALFFWLAIRAFGLFNILPIARHRVFDHLQEAIIVLDLDSHLIDFNPQAKILFEGYFKLSFGQQLIIPKEWVLNENKQQNEQIAEIHHSDGSYCYLALTITKFMGQYDKAVGTILIARDITRRRKSEEELRQSHEQLKQQYDRIVQLETKLKEQAFHDSLTGLFNRRYLDDALARECARSKRTGEPFNVIIMDIDRFKTVNDTCGHTIGDQVIRHVANYIKRNCREMDIACRYGGDEFVILMPATTRETALQRADQLRLELANAIFNYNVNDCPSMNSCTECNTSVTFSAGVACWPLDTDDPTRLFILADHAMYQAKHDGRNCVRLANMQTPTIHIE